MSTPKKRFRINNERIDQHLENKTIKRVGDFKINNRIHLDFLCLTCKEMFSRTPDQIITKNYGCPYCDNKKIQLRKDNRKNVKLLEKLNLVAVDPYTTATDRVRFKCLSCGDVRHIIVNNLKYLDNGCPKCTKKWNNDTVDAIISERNIRRLSETNLTSDWMNWECLIDGKIWDAPLNEIVNNNRGCPKCGGTEKLTNNIIDQKVSNKSVSRIGDYINNRTSIEWVCHIHDLKFFATPDIILYNQRNCYCGKDRKVTNDRIDNIIKDRNIKRLFNYERPKVKVDWLCFKCDKTWDATVGNVIYKNSGCPYCKKKNEMLVGKLIENIFEVSPLHNKKLTITEKKYFIYDYKFRYNGKDYIVEYNGEQHYKAVDIFGGDEAFYKQQERDQMLRDFCSSNNIILIEIPYWLTEEQQKDLLKSYS